VNLTSEIMKNHKLKNIINVNYKNLLNLLVRVSNILNTLNFFDLCNKKLHNQQKISILFII
jgi:hypothetical protein